MSIKTDREIAEAATDGPWYSESTGGYVRVSKEGKMAGITGENAVYTAHFNPQKVTQMLDERDKLRKLVERYHDTCIELHGTSGIDMTGELQAIKEVLGE